MVCRLRRLRCLPSTRRRSCSRASRRSPASSSSTTPPPGSRSPTGSWSTAATSAGSRPSTYEATLAFNLGDGYPIGVFVPFGVGVELLGTDAAWLIQPYIAFAAGLLALALWSLAPAARSHRRALRAASGVRRRPAGAALRLLPLGRGQGGRCGGPDRRHGGARRCGRSSARGPWRRLSAPVLVGCGARRRPERGRPDLAGADPGRRRDPAGSRDRRAGGGAARAPARSRGVAVLSVPLAISGALLPPTSSPLTDHAARGNLIAPLEPAQAAGIWISGDFRLDPAQPLITYLLIGVVCFAAVAGLVWAARSRAARTADLRARQPRSCAASCSLWSARPGSTARRWRPPRRRSRSRRCSRSAGSAASGRRLAAGARGVGGRRRRALVERARLRDVSLAPHDQLAELEQIGERVAGEGPTLMTEYEPYGVRHFLRDSDAEGISELRRHTVPLTRRQPRREGLRRRHRCASTRRRSPSSAPSWCAARLRRAARPPPTSSLWRGRYYEVWQRDRATARAAGAARARATTSTPTACPSCAAVRDLAAQGDLVAAPRIGPHIVPLSQTSYPRSWSMPQTRFEPVPTGAGTIAADVRVSRSATYEIWLGGSLRPRVDLVVDGRAGRLGPRSSSTTSAATSALARPSSTPGVHRIADPLPRRRPAPGQRGHRASAIGPLVLSPRRAADSSLVRVPAADADSLCGKAWDWIEVGVEITNRAHRGCDRGRHRPRGRRRHGPRRRLDRRPRAARDLPRARRLRHRRDLGARRLQPRPRARRGAGGDRWLGALGAARVALVGSADPVRRARASCAASPARSGSCSWRAACRPSAARPPSAPRSSCCRASSARSAARRPSGPPPARSARRSGPALGGLLTELISWQSIFLLQVPIAIVCGAALAGRRPRASARRDGSPPSVGRPAARTSPRTPPWRSSPRRWRRRSSSSSCC